MKKTIRVLFYMLCNIAILNLFACGFDDNVTYVEYAFEEKDEKSCTTIIKDEEVLEEYVSSRNMSDEMKESLLKYDKNFFQEDMIIVISQWETSGSYTIEVETVELEETVARVILEREMPDDATDDMKNWGIIIEVEKNDSIEEVTVDVEE